MRSGYDGITDFIFMKDEIEKASVILVAGGSHLELIQHAAELYHQGYGEYILPSGGKNPKLKNHETEFDFLKEEAIRLGVPESAIIKENQANHTFDNARLSYELCIEKAINIDKVILVCKNFHSRRAYLTYRVAFPKETKFLVQPIIDGKGITKKNWFLHKEYSDRVMNEVEKIGKYFANHIDKI